VPKTRSQDLTSNEATLQFRQSDPFGIDFVMISHQPENNPPFPRTSMEKLCKHPQVQIVAREDDVEFVECKDCGEVFEASEFKDMDIEEDLQDNAEAEA
jgi:hypothetical protein